MQLEGRKLIPPFQMKEKNFLIDKGDFLLYLN